MRHSIHRMMRRGIAGLAAGLLSLSMLLGAAMPVRAMESTSGAGSLTITPTYDGQELGGAVYDGTFTIYKVADYDLTGTFTKTAAFADYEGRIDDEALSVNADGNKNYNDKAFHDLTDGMTAYLNTNKASIPATVDNVAAGVKQPLDYGLYLVTQKAAGKGYAAITPFLIMTPVYGDGKTDPDAEAYAKLSLAVPSNLTSSDPPVVKVVSGSAPSDATFTFSITPEPASADYPLPELTTVSITTSTTAETEFGTIMFQQPGAYTYKVVENAGDLLGYTYDTTVYYLQYVVSFDAGHGLAVARTIHVNSLDGDTAASLTFTNSYAAPDDGDDSGDDDDDDDTPGGGGGTRGGSSSSTSSLSENGGAGNDGIGEIVEGGSIIDDIIDLVESGAFTGDESNMLLYGIVTVAAAGFLIAWIVRHCKARG